ncbi:MAG TPA: hypothetical protein V6D05_15430 [Stenomitos sp.]
MKDKEMNLKPAYARFESQLPLLKLLVARVLPGYPDGAHALVVTGACALWRAAQSYDQSGSFGDVAEAAINSELLSLMHFMKEPPELPEELEAYVERLGEMAKALGTQGTALAPYQGGLVQRPYGLTPYPEFVMPMAPGTSEGRLLSDLGDLLRRRWPLILSILLLTELGVGVMSMRAPKVYKATVTLNTGIASGQPVSGTPIDWFKAGALMGNLTEMIQSRTLLERTISKLNLGTTPEKLSKRLDVEKVGQTDMMRISAEAKSPTEAAELANTHTSEFINYYRQSQNSDAKNADAFIAQQLTLSEQRLRAAEDKLRSFKATYVPETQTGIAEQLADLQKQKGEVERALSAAQSGLSTVEREMASLKRDPMFARTVQDSTEVDTAGERLKTLRQNLEDARSVYGESSPVVQELKGQIAKATGTLQSTTAKVAAADPAHADVIARRIELKVQIAEQSAKLSNLQRAIAQIEPQVKNASVADVTYKQLQREVAIQETEYQKLQERAGQTRMAASGASLLPISIVDPAEPPTKPESSKTMVKLALGGLIALVLAFVLAYMLEVKRRGDEDLVEARLDGEPQSA